MSRSTQQRIIVNRALQRVVAITAGQAVVSSTTGQNISTPQIITTSGGGFVPFDIDNNNHAYVVGLKPKAGSSWNVFNTVVYIVQVHYTVPAP